MVLKVNVGKLNFMLKIILGNPYIYYSHRSITQLKLYNYACFLKRNEMYSLINIIMHNYLCNNVRNDIRFTE